MPRIAIVQAGAPGLRSRSPPDLIGTPAFQDQDGGAALSLENQVIPSYVHAYRHVLPQTSNSCHYDYLFDAVISIAA